MSQLPEHDKETQLPFTPCYLGSTVEKKKTKINKSKNNHKRENMEEAEKHQE